MGDVRGPVASRGQYYLRTLVISLTTPWGAPHNSLWSVIVIGYFFLKTGISDKENIKVLVSSLRGKS